MKINNIIKFLMVILISLLIILAVSSISHVYGASTMDAVSKMNGMGSSTITDTSNGKLGGIINSIIGFIQIAGTGISMIMVTLFGTKYIMASPSDKADVKKQIAPMIIGAIILFGSSNLVKIVADIAMTSLDKAAQDL